MDENLSVIPFSRTDFITRFSSRHRTQVAFLKDRLQGAVSYDRIAGYFRSSIFELIHEEVSAIGKVRIICNSDLDPRDIAVGKAAEDVVQRSMLEKWNSEDDPVASLRDRSRFGRLYELLKSGNVEIKVVSRDDAPFLHGKAGVVRYGQKRDTVNMANLVYQNTVDEKVYDKLSARMKDRYDLLGSLPDVIDDDWIDDIEAMEEGLKDFTRKKKSTADVFELRYGNFLQDDGSSWQLCEQVLDKDEAMKVLSSGW